MATRTGAAMQEPWALLHSLTPLPEAAGSCRAADASKALRVVAPRFPGSQGESPSSHLGHGSCGRSSSSSGSQPKSSMGFRRFLCGGGGSDTSCGPSPEGSSDTCGGSSSRNSLDSDVEAAVAGIAGGGLAEPSAASSSSSSSGSSGLVDLVCMGGRGGRSDDGSGGGLTGFLSLQQGYFQSNSRGSSSLCVSNPHDRRREAVSVEGKASGPLLAASNLGGSASNVGVNASNLGGNASNLDVVGCSTESSGPEGCVPAAAPATTGGTAAADAREAAAPPPAAAAAPAPAAPGATSAVPRPRPPPVIVSRPPAAPSATPSTSTPRVILVRRPLHQHSAPLAARPPPAAPAPAPCPRLVKPVAVTCTPGATSVTSPATMSDLGQFILQTTPTLPLGRSCSRAEALQRLTLKDVWSFYEEPSAFGREVSTAGGSRGPSNCYFVPYLSAIQLFEPVGAEADGRCTASSSGTDACSTAEAGGRYVCGTEGWPRHMRLRFEFFEDELPFNRTPLFERIAQLAASAGSSTCGTATGCSSTCSTALLHSSTCSTATRSSTSGTLPPYSSDICGAVCSSDVRQQQEHGPTQQQQQGQQQQQQEACLPANSSALQGAEKEGSGRGPEAAGGGTPQSSCGVCTSGVGAETATAAAGGPAAAAAGGRGSSEGGKGNSDAAREGCDHGQGLKESNVPASGGGGDGGASEDSCPPTPPRLQPPPRAAAAAAAVHDSRSPPAPPQLPGSFLLHARLSSLHPASWFAVAWYPVYRIPEAPLTARFLTYHHVVPPVAHTLSAQAPSVDRQYAPGGVDVLPLQVVGLQWYNMQAEKWLEPQKSLLGPEGGVGAGAGADVGVGSSAAASVEGDTAPASLDAGEGALGSTSGTSGAVGVGSTSGTAGGMCAAAGGGAAAVAAGGAREPARGGRGGAGGTGGRSQRQGGGRGGAAAAGGRHHRPPGGPSGGSGGTSGTGGTPRALQKVRPSAALEPSCRAQLLELVGNADKLSSGYGLHVAGQRGSTAPVRVRHPDHDFFSSRP